MRLRERYKDLIENITAVSIGPAKTTDALRTALAMGADAGVHVDVPEGTEVEPLAVARILAKIAKDDKSDAIVMGKQAIDDDSGQTGGMLSAMLNWPISNFISKLELSADGKTAETTREIDGGHEMLKLPLPAVFTTDLRLNEPRYASLPNIMKVRPRHASPSPARTDDASLAQAKKKPIKKLTPADLGIDITNRLETVNVTPPPQRKGGAKVRRSSSPHDLYHSLIGHSSIRTGRVCGRRYVRQVALQRRR